MPQKGAKAHKRHKMIKGFAGFTYVLFVPQGPPLQARAGSAATESEL
jgi:hypothetical protein